MVVRTNTPRVCLTVVVSAAAGHLAEYGLHQACRHTPGKGCRNSFNQQLECGEHLERATHESTNLSDDGEPSRGQKGARSRYRSSRGPVDPLSRARRGRIKGGRRRPALLPRPELTRDSSLSQGKTGATSKSIFIQHSRTFGLLQGVVSMGPSVTLTEIMYNGVGGVVGYRVSAWK